MVKTLLSHAISQDSHIFSPLDRAARLVIEWNETLGPVAFNEFAKQRARACAALREANMQS